MRMLLRSCSRRFGAAGFTALFGIAVLMSTLALAGCQTGASYPSKPILFVVPYAPGGGTDIMVRNIDKIATDLKVFPHPFVIENKTGGGGIVGKSYAKEKAADGYTLVEMDDSSSYGDLLGNTPWRYNEFTFIAKVVHDYNMMVVQNESRFKTFKDLLAEAKAKPKSIKVGGVGVGNNDMIHLMMISKAAGVEFNYIAFESGGQILTALLGGQIDAAMNNPAEVYEQMRAGKVRSLGITAPERVVFNDPMFKDIPTFKEMGVDVVIAQWRGIGGPTGMKAEHVDALLAGFKKVVESKEWKAEYLDKFQQISAFVIKDEFKKEVDAEYAKFKTIFDELGLSKTK